MKFCRLCLDCRKDILYVNTYSSAIYNSKVFNKAVTTITGIQIKNYEKNFQYICQICCIKITKLYQFRKQAEIHDQVLKAKYGEMLTSAPSNLLEISRCSIVRDYSADLTMTLYYTIEQVINAINKVFGKAPTRNGLHSSAKVEEKSSQLQQRLPKVNIRKVPPKDKPLVYSNISVFNSLNNKENPTLDNVVISKIVIKKVDKSNSIDNDNRSSTSEAASRPPSILRKRLLSSSSEESIPKAVKSPLYTVSPQKNNVLKLKKVVSSKKRKSLEVQSTKDNDRDSEDNKNKTKKTCKRRPIIESDSSSSEDDVADNCAPELPASNSTSTLSEIPKDAFINSLNLKPKSTNISEKSDSSSCSDEGTFQEPVWIPITQKSENIFMCDICNNMYHSQHGLKLHRRNHLKCKLCKCQFPTFELAKAHSKSNCLNDLTKNLPEIPLIKVDTAKEIVLQYKSVFDDYFLYTLNKPNPFVDDVSDNSTKDSGIESIPAYPHLSHVEAEDENVTVEEVECEQVDTAQSSNPTISESIDLIDDDDEITVVSFEPPALKQPTSNSPLVVGHIAPKISFQHKDNIHRYTDDRNENDILWNLFKKHRRKKEAETQTNFPSNANIAYTPSNLIVLENMVSELNSFKIPVNLSFSPQIKASIEKPKAAEKPKCFFNWKKLPVLSIDARIIQQYTSKRFVNIEAPAPPRSVIMNSPLNLTNSGYNGVNNLPVNNINPNVAFFYTTPILASQVNGNSIAMVPMVPNCPETSKTPNTSQPPNQSPNTPNLVQVDQCTSVVTPHPGTVTYSNIKVKNINDLI